MSLGTSAPGTPRRETTARTGASASARKNDSVATLSACFHCANVARKTTTPNSTPNRATRPGSIAPPRLALAGAGGRNTNAGARSAAAMNDRVNVCSPGVSLHAAAAVGS